jgi:hypothetical protein
MSDPFEMGRCGGSQKTAMRPAGICIGDITAPANQSERTAYSSAQATRSSCEQLTETPSLFGDIQFTATTGNTASSALCSGTKARIKQHSLSDRLTPSLISSGLVCGITPTSIRSMSGQPIRALFSNAPAGGHAAKALGENLSLSEPDDEYEGVPPMCDECFHVIEPDDGPICPACKRPFDPYRDDDTLHSYDDNGDWDQ